MSRMLTMLEIISEQLLGWLKFECCNDTHCRHADDGVQRLIQIDNSKR